MSYSSLYVIDKKFYGENAADFRNSWLFSPIVWNVLSEKYLTKKYGVTQSVIGLDGTRVWNKINDIMNGSDNTCERICWEMTNQCVFFTKDKRFVSESILEFVNTHKEYEKSDDGIGVLEREHIIERFSEISDSIMSIDESQYPYFVFKNSSCDDGVERWFAKYDSEIDEYVSSSLKDFPEQVTEFVVIVNGNIKEFIGNDKFPYEVEEMKMKVEEIAIRQEVRQMLSEAGINKNTMKEMAKGVLHEELEKAIKQALNETNTDRVISKKINDCVDNSLRRLIREEIHDKVNNVFRRMTISVDITDNDSQSVITR